MTTSTEHQEIELNSSVDWFFNSHLPPGLPIWVLAEKNKSEPMIEPPVLRVVFNPMATSDKKVKILDFDVKKGDLYLDPDNWTIKAWRMMTNHDESSSCLGVTEHSNWYPLDDSEFKTYFFTTLVLHTEINMKIAQEVFGALSKETSIWFEIRENQKNGTDLDIFSDGKHGDVTILIDFLLKLCRFTLFYKIQPVTYCVVGPDDRINGDRGGKIIIDEKSLTATLLYINDVYPQPKTIWQKLTFLLKGKDVESSFTKAVYKSKEADRDYVVGWRSAFAQNIYKSKGKDTLKGMSERYYIGFIDGLHCRFDNS